MRELLIQLAELLGYILAGRSVMKGLQGWWRELAFTGLNLAALYAFFFCDKESRSAPVFVAYVVLVSVQYLMLRLFAERKGWLPWLAFFTPILFLSLARYAPCKFPCRWGGYQLFNMRFIGISYLAFPQQLSRAGNPQWRGTPSRFPGIPRLLLFCSHDVRGAD
ncbi:hypothetical protein [Pedosphaera parvula]|uniref:Uncharacterized protein n=1 Tax=Pedosphaera parvula (strain Ellin514) TaxID=320771 RepID=B9XSL2_PEDPL|nr:hypothetical protein [Pedosphaera parvula]EEF57172.1 hypothetical protein Cflav_PD0138 [Pedosphaera parvula Ellin514]